MASHVVVLHTSGRRVKIQVTPTKYVADVFEEACQKLGLESVSYDLKISSRPLDLSQTLQQSGLPSGSKLELVLASRTPAPVSVALELPHDLASAASSKRLTEKVSSNTTLWMVLRKFELTDGLSLNLTARGRLGEDSGDSSVAGRMFYEMPVLNIMGRQFSKFIDLQKTLRQIGFHSGTCLIRLEFKRTDQLIREAMKQMTEYFEEVPTEPTPDAADKSQSLPTSASQDLQDSQKGTFRLEDVSDTPSAAGLITSPATSNLAAETGDRPITVFRPPKSSVPQAASIPHQEDDYEPTAAHAKLHQNRLLGYSRNVRLLSDVENEQLEKAKAARLEDITEVTIKIRFPDQTTSVSSFKPDETGYHLYAFVSKLIVEETRPFKLIWRDRGPRVVPNDEKKLVNDLGFGSRMLIYFTWEGTVEPNDKTTVLKSQYLENSSEVTVFGLNSQIKESHESEEKRPGTKKQKGVGKWFKGIGKK